MDVFDFVAVTILEHLLLCQEVKKPCWCCWFEEGEDPLTIELGLQIKGFVLNVYRSHTFCEFFR
jgi:hypothetical protein